MEDYGGEGVGCCAAEEGALSVLLNVIELASFELEILYCAMCCVMNISKASSKLMPLFTFQRPKREQATSETPKVS